MMEFCFIDVVEVVRPHPKFTKQDLFVSLALQRLFPSWTAANELASTCSCQKRPMYFTFAVAGKRSCIGSVPGKTFQDVRVCMPRQLLT